MYQKEGGKDDGTGAIYQFFKDLTSGNMKIEDNSNIPFSLFITTQRRRKILSSMWSGSEREKKEGEKILANYKKQLAEKLAREQAEKSNNLFSRPTSGSRGSRRSKMNATITSNKTNKTSKTRERESEAQKLIQQKLHEISNF